MSDLSISWPDQCCSNYCVEGLGVHNVDHEDAVTLVGRVRPLLAEVWDLAVRECHDLGWLHDFAKSDAMARNPYRPPVAR